MASETRRIAQALVERRTERFDSRHSLEESKARLDAAFARLQPRDATDFTPEWTVEGGATRLEAHFAPSRRAQRLLLAASIALTLLVAASAWTILSPQEDAAIGFLVPLLTVLAIFAFPLVAVALGSHREAEEAGIRRAIRKALLDEDDRFPAPQRWDD